MPRIRSIKPEAFTSEDMAAIPRAARWTFAGLWTYCDDEGRGRADPRLIRAALYPLDDDVTSQCIGSELSLLEQVGLICRYEHDGKGYFHVPTFKIHQHPNRPQGSKLPPCPHSEHPPRVSAGQVAHEQHTASAVNGHGTHTAVVVEEGSSRGGERETSELALRTARPDVERLCTHLADRIEANGSKRPTIGQRWHDAARLLLDTDGHTETEVHTAIDWCQHDGFWRGNVLSMPKLREKYDQLRLAAQAGRTPTRGGTDDRVAGHLALAQRLAEQQQLTTRPHPFGEIA